LADGRLVLVPVQKRSRLAYLRFLLQLATKGVVPGALPFVRVEHVTDLQVRYLYLEQACLETKVVNVHVNKRL
jgi:hypothetical protein